MTTISSVFADDRIMTKDEIQAVTDVFVTHVVRFGHILRKDFVSSDDHVALTAKDLLQYMLGTHEWIVKASRETFLHKTPVIGVINMLIDQAAVRFGKMDLVASEPNASVKLMLATTYDILAQTERSELHSFEKRMQISKALSALGTLGFDVAAMRTRYEALCKDMGVSGVHVSSVEKMRSTSIASRPMRPLREGYLP